jgi:hypothetical protein
MKEFLRDLLAIVICMGGTLVVLFLLFILVGCTSLPDSLDECAIAPYNQQWETAEECKMAVIKREDRRHERRQRQAIKDACLYPLVWVGDVRTGSCRSGNTVIL